MKHLWVNEKTKAELIALFKIPIDQLIEKELIKNPNSNGCYTSNAKSIKYDHRTNMLDRGRTDFDLASNGLTADEKIDLYCYYYFQMHFLSCYLVYGSEIAFLRNRVKNREVWFIDIGCGPFTSGYSFFKMFQRNEIKHSQSINYIGLDLSIQMLSKARFLCKNMTSEFYSSCFYTNKLSEIINILQKSISKRDDLLIILNYSYFFSSKSLLVSDYITFTQKLINEFCNVGSSTMSIYFQNPNLSSLNVAWNAYKANLPNFTSIKNYPKVHKFMYDDILGSSNANQPKFDVSCDILYLKN